MFSSLVETQMESIPVTEQTSKGHYVQHPTSVWYSARTRNREQWMNFSPAVAAA